MQPALQQSVCCCTRDLNMRVLSLSEALKSNKLPDFILQEEARGIGPAETARLEQALSALIKAPRSEDQTSRSPSNDDLSETKTR